MQASLLHFFRSTFILLLLTGGLLTLPSCSLIGNKKDILESKQASASVTYIKTSVIPDFIHLPTQPNPLANKVDLYLNLLKATQKSIPGASIYAAFLAENPLWPNRTYLQKKLEFALINEKEDALVSPLCQNNILLQTASYLRCARIPVVFTALTRKIHTYWQNNVFSAQDEAALLTLFKNYLSTEDYWRRFLLFEKNNSIYAAQRQIPRLTDEQKPLARAILAFHADDLHAEDLLKPLDSKQTSYPTLVLNRLRWLRRANRLEDAIKLWKEKGLLAEASSQNQNFWIERRILSTTLLERRHLKEASDVAYDPACSTPSLCADTAFLSGWISLQFLHKPTEAIRYFTRMTAVESIDIRTKGQYWLGRTYQALNDPVKKETIWKEAARFPTTFYGQLALASLSKNKEILSHYFDSPSEAVPLIQEQLKQLSPPSWTSQQAIDYISQELVMAGITLLLRNDTQHAKAFFLLDSHQNPTPEHLALAAFFAEKLHLPDVAVLEGRTAAKAGLQLYPYGWSIPYMPFINAVQHRALTLAIIRQESSFNPTIASPAGAVGLMQLMPATAQELAKKANISLPSALIPTLTHPDVNITLGNAYSELLLKQFHGILPYVIASYNAGPKKVQQWLKPNPLHITTLEMIDWLEAIPFSETRHYVQHVWENMLVYQTQLSPSSISYTNRTF